MITLDAHGPAAARIVQLAWLLFGVCGLVYIAVLLATVWALARKRRDSDDSPETDRRLRYTITAAAITTVAILAGLLVASERTGQGLITPPGRGAVTIDVIGRQWWWEFQYRDVTPSDWVSSPNELHLPVGVPVVLRAISRDVIHSFWVPQLHGKRDLIPGQITEMWIQADTPGVYRGRCAEFCGHQHAQMALTVVAESTDQFQTWIQQQRRPAREPVAADERTGRDFFLTTTCATCHSIRGTSAAARIGPDLTHLASRRSIAAATLPNDRRHLEDWIRRAQSIKPGVRMPSHQLSDDDAASLVAYLRSLR
jgi:cytochrome c oxidase subunit 2